MDVERGRAIRALAAHTRVGPAAYEMDRVGSLLEEKWRPPRDQTAVAAWAEWRRKLNIRIKDIGKLLKVKARQKRAQGNWRADAEAAAEKNLPHKIALRVLLSRTPVDGNQRIHTVWKKEGNGKHRPSREPAVVMAAVNESIRTLHSNSARPPPAPTLSPHSPEKLLQVTTDMEKVTTLCSREEWATLVVGKAIPAKKSPGPDGVRREWLIATPALSELMRCITNACMRIGTVPDPWSDTSITPISKKEGADLTLDNSRPISLVPTGMRLFESLMRTRLYKVLRDHKLLHASQHGFIEDSRLQRAIRIVSHTYATVTAEHKEAHTVYADIAGAFPTVPHWAVREGLKHIGATPHLIKLLMSMVEGRRARTETAYGLTPPVPLQAGVPQGAVLSPLYWALVMDPVMRALAEEKDSLATVDGVLVPPHAFADDLWLFATTSEGMQRLWTTAATVLSRYGLRLSAKKTFYVSTCPTTSPPLTLSYDDYPIAAQPPNTPLRYLGVILRLDAKWSDHVETVTVKCRKIIVRMHAEKVGYQTCKYVVNSVLHGMVAFTSSIVCHPEWTHAVQQLDKAVEDLLWHKFGMPLRSSPGPIHSRSSMNVAPLMATYLGTASQALFDALNEGGEYRPEALMLQNQIVEQTLTKGAPHAIVQYPELLTDADERRYPWAHLAKQTLTSMIKLDQQLIYSGGGGSRREWDVSIIDIFKATHTARTWVKKHAAWVEEIWTLKFTPAVWISEILEPDGHTITKWENLPILLREARQGGQIHGGDTNTEKSWYNTLTKLLRSPAATAPKGEVAARFRLEQPMPDGITVTQATREKRKMLTLSAAAPTDSLLHVTSKYCIPHDVTLAQQAANWGHENYKTALRAEYLQNVDVPGVCERHSDASAKQLNEKTEKEVTFASIESIGAASRGTPQTEEQQALVVHLVQHHSAFVGELQGTTASTNRIPRGVTEALLCSDALSVCIKGNRLAMHGWTTRTKNLHSKNRPSWNLQMQAISLLQATGTRCRFRWGKGHTDPTLFPAYNYECNRISDELADTGYALAPEDKDWYFHPGEEYWAFFHNNNDITGSIYEVVRQAVWDKLVEEAAERAPSHNAGHNFLNTHPDLDKTTALTSRAEVIIARAHLLDCPALRVRSLPLTPEARVVAEQCLICPLQVRGDSKHAQTCATLRPHRDAALLQMQRKLDRALGDNIWNKLCENQAGQIREMLKLVGHGAHQVDWPSKLWVPHIEIPVPGSASPTRVPTARFWTLCTAWSRTHGNVPVNMQNVTLAEAISNLYADAKEMTPELRRNGWATPPHLVRLTNFLTHTTGELYSCALNMTHLLEAHASLRPRDTDFGCVFDATHQPLFDRFWLINTAYSVGRRGGPSSPHMTTEVARCISLLDDGLPEPHRAVLVCPYELGPSNSVWKQLQGTSAEILFTILAGEISFDDGLSWDASHIKLRATPTTFDFAFIIFQNAAARYAHPMPPDAHACVMDWAMTYCKHGTRGIILGPALSANLLTTVPTPEQLRDSALQEVTSALASRYSPFDASGSELTSNYPKLKNQTQPPLFAALHATPIRAWQLSYLPTTLIEALPFLQVRRPATTAARLRTLLLEGLNSIWSAAPYQTRLPPRDSSHQTAPNNISRTARLSNAKRRVDSVLTPSKHRRTVTPATDGHGQPPVAATVLVVSTNNLNSNTSGSAGAAPAPPTTVRVRNTSTKRQADSAPTSVPPPKRPAPSSYTPNTSLPSPSTTALAPLTTANPTPTGASGTKRKADSDPNSIPQPKHFRPP
jgi:hypothetical protein